MELKETIISSFFFHLVLFLFVLGLANFRAGFSGNLPDIISVNLTAENNAPTAKTDTVGKSAPPSPPAHEEKKLSEQATENQPGEMKEIPSPENKPAPADLPKIDIPGRPAGRSRGSDSREAYYQFVTLHRKVFAQKAEVKVNDLLGKALAVNTRQFYGGIGVVTLTFGGEGELDKVEVDSASSDLKAFLERIGWYDMPAPASYLGHTMQIQFTVLEGSMAYRVTIL